MRYRFLKSRSAGLRRSVVIGGAAIAVLGVATSIAVASVSGGQARSANPTLAQWHSRVKAELATLRKLSTQPAKTQYPAIPKDTPCSHPKTKSGNLRVGLALASRSNSAVVQIAVSLEEYMKSSPEVSQVITADSEDNPSKTISDVQSMLTRGIDVLVADPTTLAASPAIKLACQKGITVVVYDRFLKPNTPVTATMYADEVQDGYFAGQAIVNALHGKGNVVMIGGIPGLGVSDARLNGAKLAMKKAPGIKILATTYSNYDTGKGRTIMEELLSKYPKIDAVFGDSGLQSIGAVQALVAANRLKEVKMITGGQLNGYLKLWKKLGFHGFGATVSMDIGMLAGQMALDIATGKYLPTRNVPGPLAIVDQAHLDDFLKPQFPDSYWATTLVPLSVLQKVFKAG